MKDQSNSRDRLISNIEPHEWFAFLAIWGPIGRLTVELKDWSDEVGDLLDVQEIGNLFNGATEAVLGISREGADAWLSYRFALAGCNPREVLTLIAEKNRRQGEPANLFDLDKAVYQGFMLTSVEAIARGEPVCIAKDKYEELHDIVTEDPA